MNREKLKHTAPDATRDGGAARRGVARGAGRTNGQGSSMRDVEEGECAQGLYMWYLCPSLSSFYLLASRVPPRSHMRPPMRISPLGVRAIKRACGTERNSGPQSRDEKRTSETIRSYLARAPSSPLMSFRSSRDSAEIHPRLILPTRKFTE